MCDTQKGFEKRKAPLHNRLLRGPTVEKRADSLDQYDWETSFHKAIPAKPVLDLGKRQISATNWSSALHCNSAQAHYIILYNCDQFNINVCLFEAEDDVRDRVA
jgi:hypothetical protein